MNRACTSSPGQRAVRVVDRGDELRDAVRKELPESVSDFVQGQQGTGAGHAVLGRLSAATSSDQSGDGESRGECAGEGPEIGRASGFDFFAHEEHRGGLGATS